MAFTLSLTATPQGPTEVLATLNNVFTVTGWSLTLDGEPVTIVSVANTSTTTWVLTTDTLRPGRTYVLEVTTDDPDSDTDDFAVPTTTPWIDYTKWPLPFPKKLLEATTYAFGKELQFLGGQPETVLAENYTAHTNYFRVGSTLGAQPSGSVMVGGRKFAYTSKTQTHLLGVTGDWTFENIPKGAKVVFSPKTALPSTWTPGVPIGAYTTITALETKALVFDGIVDYAYAENVINAASTYTVFVKLLVGNPAGSFKNIFHTADSDIAGPNDFAQWSDIFQTAGTSLQYYRAIGLRSDGVTASYSRQSSSDTVNTTSAGVLIALTRLIGTSQAVARVYRTDTGAAVWAPATLTVTSGTTPDILVLAAGLNKTLTPVAGFYSPIRLIAAGIVAGQPTSDQLASYATKDDARPILTNLSHYWSVDRLGSGDTEIAPVVGTEPLRLFGPAFADLIGVT